jgi:hypothetical protein
MERQSQIVGGQIEVFCRAQPEATLSDKVIPIKAVHRPYVSMDCTGVTVVEMKPSDRRGKDGSRHLPVRFKPVCYVYMNSLPISQEAVYLCRDFL